MQNTANKTTLVQSPFTTLGQKMRRAYFTMLPSPHGAFFKQHRYYKLKATFQLQVYNNRT